MGWGIYGLIGLGINDSNGWGSYGKSILFFGRYSQKNTGYQGSTLSGPRMATDFGSFEQDKKGWLKRTWMVCFLWVAFFRLFSQVTFPSEYFMYPLSIVQSDTIT